MYSTNKSPSLNPMARQEIYISPRLYPLNKAYSIDSSDDSMTSSNTNSTPLFSSNDSLSSFEDYKIQAELEIKEEKKVSLANCNRGFISSVCCSFCKRD
jgi:hypothetical protein